MVYGSIFNIMLKENTDITNKEKVIRLKSYKISDLLTLLRNIEENPKEYDEEIIDAVYLTLYDNRIICI